MTHRDELFSSKQSLLAFYDTLFKDAKLTAFTQAIGTVGTASSTLLNANANRRYALVTNDSDTAIYLKIGAAAVVGNSIRINANGGCFEIDYGNLMTGTITGITPSTGAFKNVCIFEGS